jgi:hypothetical protein
MIRVQFPGREVSHISIFWWLAGWSLGQVLAQFLADILDLRNASNSKLLIKNVVQWDYVSRIVRSPVFAGIKEFTMTHPSLDLAIGFYFHMINDVCQIAAEFWVCCLRSSTQACDAISLVLWRPPGRSLQ